MLRSAVICALVLGGLPASADTIANACRNSDRAASSALCNCIQRAADVKLSSSDQQLAAKFFADPHLSQVTRQSDNPSNEAFWTRYKEFGDLAGKTCG